MSQTMPVDALISTAMAARTGAAVPAPRPAAPRPRYEVAGGGVPSREARDTDIQQAIGRLNDYIQTARRDLRFTVDEASGRSVVKVIDSETGDLIRQIPPDEVLALSRIIGEMIKRSGGIILTDRA